MSTPRRRTNPKVVLWSAYAGIAIFLAVVATWVTRFHESPAAAKAVLAGIAALAYGGKEAGIPVGLAAGSSVWELGLFIFFADVAFALIVYAIVHFALDGWMRRDNAFGRFLRLSQERATRHAGLVQRYGPLGLFLFMLIPFAFNGPLLGAILGRLLGLAATRILPVMLLSIAVTTAVWSTIYAYGFAYAVSLSPSLPTFIAGFALALVTASLLVGFLWHGRSPPAVEAEALAA